MIHDGYQAMSDTLLCDTAYHGITNINKLGHAIVIYSLWGQVTQKGATNSSMCYVDMDDSHRWVPIVVRAVTSFTEKENHTIALVFDNSD